MVAAIRALKEEVLLVIPAMVVGQRELGVLVPCRAGMAVPVRRELLRILHAPGQTKSKPAVVLRIVIGAPMELAIVQPALPKATLIQSLARPDKQVSKPIRGIPQVVLMN